MKDGEYLIKREEGGGGFENLVGRYQERKEIGSGENIYLLNVINLNF